MYYNLLIFFLFLISTSTAVLVNYEVYPSLLILCLSELNLQVQFHRGGLLLRRHKRLCLAIRYRLHLPRCTTRPNSAPHRLPIAELRLRLRPLRRLATWRIS